jgi:enamine deaminase RidA (YjgF/YER057c/UK114 family)
MTNPFGSYTHVVEVNGPGRTIYIAGQLGINGAGRQGADFREQTTLAYENLKAAIESVGGKVENIVKLNAYVPICGRRRKMMDGASLVTTRRPRALSTARAN